MNPPRPPDTSTVTALARLADDDAVSRAMASSLDEFMAADTCDCEAVCICPPVPGEIP